MLLCGRRLTAGAGVTHQSHLRLRQVQLLSGKHRLQGDHALPDLSPTVRPHHAQKIIKKKKKKIQTGLHTHNLCLCVFSVHRLKITNQGRVKVEYVWQVIMESAPPDIGTGVSQEGISFYQS